MSKPEHIADTERYVDSIFGPGTGEAHVRFLDRIQNEALREMIHRYHVLEADTSRRRRAEVIDHVAAGFILQGLLDRLGHLG